MNPIENFLTTFISNQEYLLPLLPDEPSFSAEYMKRTSVEQQMRKVSVNYTMKMFSEIQSKQKQPEPAPISAPKTKSTGEYSISDSCSFEMGRKPTSATSISIKEEKIISKSEEIQIIQERKVNPVKPLQISSTIEIPLLSTVKKEVRRIFDESRLTVDQSRIELKGKIKAKSEIFYSHSFWFELRLPPKPAKRVDPNYIIKEENFLILNKIPEPVQTAAALTSSDFTPPKNFKIINNKPDFLSQSINEKSPYNFEVVDQRAHSPAVKYVYNAPKVDLNKSEIVAENDLNQTAGNIHPTDLDSSIIMNKSNNEIKKTELLIEQLSSKLKPYFDKFEKDQLSSQQINDIVKKELTPLRPLFISSKNIKEKVFVALSEGKPDKYNFLNYVFKIIIEESLKNINIKSGTYKPVTPTPKIISMQSKSPDKDIMKKIPTENHKLVQQVGHSPVYDKVSPVKKIRTVNSGGNYDSNNGNRKSLGNKVHVVNISNDKSIHTKNNINISIQPSAYKNKIEFTELPYIK